MALSTRKPIKSAASLDAFIGGAAPDGLPMQATAATPAKTIRTAGRKTIITVSIAPETLDRVDTWSSSRGMSRAAAISFAISLLDKSA